MAEEEISFLPSADKLLGGVDAVTGVIIQILLYVCLALIIWGCFYLLSFKHKVRIRQETGSGVVIIDTKAREFKTKQGITKWRLLKFLKESHIAPQTNFLELTNKAKFSAECDRSRDGVITWRVRNKDGDKPDILSGEERSMTIDEMRRANYNKQSNIDKVLALAPVMIVAIILVIMFAFWGEITKGTNQVAADNRASAERIAVASELLASSNDRLSNLLVQLYPELRDTRNFTSGDVVGTPFNPPN